MKQNRKAEQMTMLNKSVWMSGYRSGYRSGFQSGFLTASLCAIAGWILGLLSK